MLNIGFLLYHTGETKALLPAIQSLALHSHKYKITIIPVGVSALNILPGSLNKLCKKALLIKDYLGLNDDYKMHFSDKYVYDIINLLEKSDIIISGCPAQIQYQVIKLLPKTTKKIIIFDAPYKHDLVNKFTPYADHYIFTDNKSLSKAQKKLAHKVRLFCARHGDFDIWLANHHKNLRAQSKIRKKIGVCQTDKIILWLGGYGDLSEDDQELRGFINFLKVFQKVKDKFKLRITMHPGLEHFNPHKRLKILNKYYLMPLHDLGYNKKQTLESISNLDSNQVASIACGVVSINSTTAQQAVYIGTPAKYIYLANQNLRGNIEVVKSNKRWQEIFTEWFDKSDSQNKYLEALNKLEIPLDNSLEQEITRIILENL